MLCAKLRKSLLAHPRVTANVTFGSGLGFSQCCIITVTTLKEVKEILLSPEQLRLGIKALALSFRQISSFLRDLRPP
jgi:hypothetical protein